MGVWLPPPAGFVAVRLAGEVKIRVFFSAVLMKGMVWMGVPHSLGSGSASLATLPAHLVFRQLMPSSLLP